MALGLAAGTWSCAAPQVESAPAFPPYSPAEAALFDDTISVDIFESAAVEPPASETKLTERVVLADTVIPARITTVTRDAMDTVRSYTLVLKPTGPPLVGATAPDRIPLTITTQSPAFVRVRGAEATLVNKHLILFLRHYEVDGIEMLHWRAESDTEATRTAISRATAVRAGRAED